MPGGVIRGSGRRRLFAGVGLLMLAACTDAPPEPPGPVFPVTLKDFWTETETDTAPPGLVTFRVTNEGKATHEFVVVRTDLPADALPLGPDGLSVSEDAVEPLDELTEVPAGETLELALSLEPGSYVFFCNLEGHYLSGMRDRLIVTDERATDLVNKP
jgi:plastocyanin